MSLLKKVYREYDKLLREINFKIPTSHWILTSVGLAFGVWGLLTALSILNILVLPDILVFTIAFVVLDLMLGYPYLKAQKRIDEIEEALPDALKQMADTLKAGGTFEYALRGISTNQYGYLTVEMKNILRRLDEGENLANSMRAFSKSVSSRIVKRSINIILDSIEAGASLADILDEIADDVKANYRVKQERKSTTLMQVLFMFAAGGIVAPFIFGLVSVVIDFLVGISIKTQGIKGQKLLEILNKKEAIVSLLRYYIFIEAAASAAMIAMIREGRATVTIIYVPILLLIAFTTYFVSRFGVSLMLSGIT